MFHSKADYSYNNIAKLIAFWYIDENQGGKKEMKKVGKAALISIIAVCLLALALGAGKNPESRYTIDTPYEYPHPNRAHRNGSTSKMSLTGEKVCQIPDEILYNMTTDALLETVIDYPFRSDMYAFNDFRLVTKQ